MTSKPLRLFLLTALGIAAFVGCEEAAAPAPVSPGAARGIPVDAPRLRLRVSGNLGGYLMPCGCASGQMGGLARRAFRNNLDGRSIDLFLEGGNLTKETGELEFQKLITALEVLSQGDRAYHAVGLAAADLEFATEDLAPLVMAFPFVASDLVLAGGKPWQDEGDNVVPAFREVKLEKVTARIGSLTMSPPEGTNAKFFAMLKPQEGWSRAMQGAAEATYRIAMVHADRDVVRKLALSPKPDLVIAVNGDYVEPPPHAASTDDGVPMVHVGVHGRLLLDVTIVRGPDGSVVTKHEPVPLKGSRTAEGAMRDKEAMAVILGHRQTVKEDNMLERLAGQKDLPKGDKYVGAKACADCHDDDSETCAKHAHSHAWRTLQDAEKREKWPVTSYPECVSCHVAGYGYKTGFVSPTKTAHLLNVTCENCHGPGGKHAASEAAADIIGKPSVSSCTKCHNFEHSPKFDYTSYWKKISHGK